MGTYILLLTLTADGRQRINEDPESLPRAEEQAESEVIGAQCLGTYAVLGRYDFVNILEAEDNEVAARFSLELGVRAGAHVETLPAVPVGLLQERDVLNAQPGSTALEPEEPLAPAT